MRSDQLKRRQFVTLLGGAAAASSSLWPLAVRAQQPGRVRRIGILSRGVETERIVQAERGALREGLAKLGWTEGRNVRFEFRISADDPDLLRTHAEELVRLAPDVIVVGSVPATRLVLLRTRSSDSCRNCTGAARSRRHSGRTALMRRSD